MPEKSKGDVYRGDLFVRQYPKRPQFYAMKLIRLLCKAEIANSIGAQATLLVAFIATQEDAKRYQFPVTMHVGQLLSMVGATNWKKFEEIRQRAIDAGWLHYIPPPTGSRRPGTYWTKFPSGQGLEDAPLDEGVSNEELAYKKGYQAGWSDATVNKGQYANSNVVRDVVGDVVRHVERDVVRDIEGGALYICNPIPKPVPIPNTNDSSEPDVPASKLTAKGGFGNLPDVTCADRMVLPPVRTASEANEGHSLEPPARELIPGSPSGTALSNAAGSPSLTVPQLDVKLGSPVRTASVADEDHSLEPPARESIPGSHSGTALSNVAGSPSLTVPRQAAELGSPIGTASVAEEGHSLEPPARELNPGSHSGTALSNAAGSPSPIVPRQGAKLGSPIGTASVAEEGHSLEPPARELNPGSHSGTALSNAAGSPSPVVPRQGASSQPPSGTVMTFQCVGVVKEFHLSQTQLDRWQATYPNLDVRQECFKAWNWIEVNTRLRKTARGMLSFLVNWLNRVTNYSNGGGYGRQASSRGNCGARQSGPGQRYDPGRAREREVTDF